ncbi:uncharacterized protein KD926_004374 [Aspergillus affinis]|uniref:uncharacterized protein n=1 Tax=Aspergillus affinis TaxID=1070780 RepID=UPI0022FE765D|nr:uncharacterized protein KD926_004374 [Aspergillus affinis]KAI9043191.1 hypothetical protein KD926_004374 [Aspergillus affinis]
MAAFLLRSTILWILTIQVLCKAVNRSSLVSYLDKPRVFILSYISTEPDDQESLTRYLLYSNQFQTEGLVASTSTWLRDETHPEDMLQVINAYGNVTQNLNQHAPPDAQYRSGDYFRSILRSGPKVLAWGGTNVLAQVVYKINQNFSPSEAATLRSRLRVYAISDQDDTGAWIRRNYPDIFYISSTHGWNHYGLATWIAISGETYYGVDEGGPNGSTVTHQWLRDNIQICPYGSVAYPSFKYIMEGDTPTFLYLIQNGLGDPENPGYGSWGGRYTKVDPSTEWSLPANVSKANHHPVVSVNGSTELSPFKVTAMVGSPIRFDTTGTYDPDGDELSYNWFQYQEPGSDDWNVAGQVPALNLTVSDNGQRVQMNILSSSDSCNGKGDSPSGCWLLHLILEVKDNGANPLTTYRRVLIQATNQTMSS